MDGSERVFLDTLLIALIPTIPVAVGVLMNYLKIKSNTRRIDNRPTRDELGDAIHDKVNELVEKKMNGSGGTT